MPAERSERWHYIIPIAATGRDPLTIDSRLGGNRYIMVVIQREK
jgi:hypothetical protein